MKKTLFGVALLAMTAAAALAGPAAKPEGGQERMRINLSNVTLHSVVQYISLYYGKPVQLPEAFGGERKVNVVSRGAEGGIPEDDAMLLFTSELRKAGYALVDRGAYLEVVNFADVKTAPVRTAPAETGLEAQTVCTTFIPLKNVDASEVDALLAALASKTGKVAVFKPLNGLFVTDHGVNIAAMRRLIAQIDVVQSEYVTRLYEARNVSASTLRALATNHVDNLKSTANPQWKKRLENFAMTVNAETNALILYGHKDDIAGVETHLKLFDVKPSGAAKRYHIYRVLNRDVQEMKDMLDQILGSVTLSGGETVPPIGGRTAIAMGGESPKVIADVSNSSLVVIATQDRYNTIKPMLEELDSPRAQVEIEARLVEVSTEVYMDIGLELASLDGASDSARGFAGTTFDLSTLGDDGKIPAIPTYGGLTAGIFKNEAGQIAALLRLSQKDEGVSFIAAPRIMTVNHQTATISSKEQREYQNSVISPEGNTSEVTGGNFNTASIELKITPHVNDQGTVRLVVETKTEQFLPSTTTAAGDELSNIATREAKSEVVVGDGRTVVIAGMARTVKGKTTQKVPFFGDLPFIGWLGRRQVDSEEERHLCIFITPKVHKASDSPSLSAETARREKELNDSTARVFAAPEDRYLKGKAKTPETGADTE